MSGSYVVSTSSCVKKQGLVKGEGPFFKIQIWQKIILYDKYFHRSFLTMLPCPLLLFVTIFASL